MSEFTKGPWIKDKFSEFSFDVFSEHECSDIAIAELVRNEADANLIACAPEMYEMLVRQRQGLLNLLDLDVVASSYHDSIMTEVSEIDDLLARVKG